MRRSSRLTLISPRSSASSAAAPSVALTSSGRPSGSPKATSSSTSRTSGSSWPMRLSTTSARVGVRSNRPVHRQTPYASTRSPPAARREHQFAQEQRVAGGQVPQPVDRAAARPGRRARPASRSAVSARVSGPRSTRSTRSSIHSARTGSGAGAPVRSVPMTVAWRARASWCTSVAESGSSRCASSMASTTGRPPPMRWTASMAQRSAPPGPARPAGSAGSAAAARLASGRCAVAALPATVINAYRAGSRAPVTARSNRLLPIPGLRQ